MIGPGGFMAGPKAKRPEWCECPCPIGCETPQCCEEENRCMYAAQEEENVSELRDCEGAE